MNAHIFTSSTAPAVSRLFYGGILFRLLSILLGLLCAGRAFAQSSNNNFDNRTRLAGDNVTAPTVNTTGAGRETDEPAHPGAFPQTLWWEWVAPQTATYTIDTDASAIDTILAVYVGSALTRLDRVAANDDPPGSSTRARLTLTTTAGTAYQIVVAPGSGANGNVVLKIALAGPAAAPSFTGSDNFDRRPRVTIAPFLGEAETTGGGRENREPAHPGAFTQTIWWEWVAPQTGTYSVDTAGSEIDTIVAVYEGNTLDVLQRVVANDNPPATTRARATLTTTAGTAYQIVVAPGSGSNGNVNLKVSFVGQAAAPSYTGTEAFNNRPQITAAVFLGQAECTGGAGRESGEPGHAGGAFPQTNWWQWTAPGNGNVTIDLTGETIDSKPLDTVLNVYSGSTINQLNRVRYSDDAPGTVFSRVTFPTSAGQIYQLVASPGSGATGTFRLAFSYTAVSGQPPALTGTDDYLLRPTLSGVKALGVGETTFSSRQSGEPAHPNSFTPSTWWQWIAPANGSLTLDTDGSLLSTSAPFDTTLTVYRGTDNITQLVFVASNTNAPGRVTSRLESLPVTAGTAYQIVVCPGNGSNGNVSLALDFQASIPNDPVIPPAIGLQPASQTVTVGGPASFTVGATGPALTYQWQFNGADISGANSTTFSIPSASVAHAGSYRVVVSNSGGTVISAVATLTVNPIQATPPRITVQPRPVIVAAGNAATFGVEATGVALSYQWQFNGADIPGATAATFTVAKVSGGKAGNYRVLVANSGGTAVSDVAILTVIGRLGNLSVRTTAGTGSDTLIVGFTLSGGGRQMLIRGIGPGLAQFGLPGTLPDPTLTLLQDQVQVSFNDNWGGGQVLRDVFASVGAFSLSPSSLDAALYNRLEPAGYSAKLAAKTDATGIALLELYDVDGDGAARLTNLSARSQAGTGDGVLIVGFNITDGPLTLLIRGIGPTLASFGVGGTLIDPKLEVFTGDKKMVENDNWDPILASIFASVGAFPLVLGSRDAALRVTLQPGSYTAQVSGMNNTSGVALVEVYELP